jgi:hypothetical protein
MFLNLNILVWIFLDQSNMDPAIDNGICNEAYDKLLTHEFHHEGGDFDEVN